jgi:hypothetical protein
LDGKGEKKKALQLLKRYFQHRPSYELYKKALDYADQTEKEAVREELYSSINNHYHSNIKAEIDYYEGNSKELLHFLVLFNMKQTLRNLTIL